MTEPQKSSQNERRHWISRWRRLAVLVLGLMLLLSACVGPLSPSLVEFVAVPEPAEKTLPAPAEQPVTQIPLAGPTATQDAEISGMTWYGDRLVLMPQYPNLFGEGDGVLFVLEKQAVVDALDGASAEPLTPQPLPLDAPGIAESIEGFEGFEGIAFAGDQVFMTIEAETDEGMQGYIVTGKIEPDLSALHLVPETLTPIDPQSPVGNMSDETILVVEGENGEPQVVTIYEANGVAVNPDPVAHRFDANLAELDPVPFPNIEYRVTDATTVDDEGRFWAINYFFPGDTELAAAVDPLVEEFGEGETHLLNEAVERLVPFEYSPDGISFTGETPIQLQLLPEDARNWEGIVRLDDQGFLLVTDKFPETILAFVPLP